MNLQVFNPCAEYYEVLAQRQCSPTSTQTDPTEEGFESFLKVSLTFDHVEIALLVLVGGQTVLQILNNSNL